MSAREVPEDPFGEWQPVIEDAVSKAIGEWLSRIDGQLRPTVLAAGEETSDIPDFMVLLTAAGVWSTIVGESVTPLVMGLVARRILDVLGERGIPVELLGEATAPAAGARSAVAALHVAGVPADGVERILSIPTWVDYIDGQATMSTNLVKGMPEATYRDLVTKLSAATRDGMAPPDRATLAHQFLDKGADQWKTRARLISRTETNRLVNAATHYADLADQAITGDELEKIWIAATDERTRPDHSAAHGQRVPLDAKFDVGGHQADYPGDPTLPVGQSANCRCTTVTVVKGEPLPVGVPGGQVTPTRDTNDRQTVTAAAEETPMRTQWSGVLAPVGKPTGDGRIIDDDADIQFREFPLPLMFQKATGDGHDTAVVVGKITDASVDGGSIVANGEFFDSPEAAEAADLVAEEVNRPSVDLCDMVAEWEFLDADGKPINPDDDDATAPASDVMHIRAATVMAATLVSKPAFGEAKIVVGEKTEAPTAEDDEDALVAAAALLDAPTVPALAFDNPHLDGPTGLTVTDDGRVFGHLALWGTEHIGMPGKRVTPPRSRTDYALFHVSTVDTDAGAVSCGRLTVGCGHAGARAGMRDATAHYDQAGTCWALVRAGEDAHGIWVSGVVNPDAEASTVRAGAAAPLSGDWRSVGGNLELVAALSVNTPGFPVPRSYAATSTEELSLVAAGVAPRRDKADELADAIAEGIRRHEDRRAAEAAQAATDKRSADARRLAASIIARKVVA